MSKLMIALFVAAGLGVSGLAAAQSTTLKISSASMSKDGHAMAMKHADARYKMDNQACASLSGNARDICGAEATGRDAVARADATAAYENTPQAREASRVAHAQADYDVAIEKCDDLAGNRKDVCVKEAKAALVKGKADAKVDRVSAVTSQDAAAKQADARKDASEEKREADYRVAVEKCDDLAGPAKDACLGTAKMQYGKS